MEINYISVLACGVIAMVLGFLWYGPIFGKTWLRIIGASEADLAARKDMQKRAMPLYVVTFVLALFQAYVLAHFIKGWEEASGTETALWIFGAFIVPTVASASMWNNDKGSIAWARFLIQGGYYLVLFAIMGFVLGTWG